jgi:RibD domain-containing protein
VSNPGSCGPPASAERPATLRGVRRVLAQQWVSVDGFAAGPDGEQEIFEAAGAAASADSERHITAVLDGVDVVLLGRRSYEAFAAFWPVAHDQPMAARVNAVPKVVCSTTLTAAPWGDFAPARSSPTAAPTCAACVRSRAATC